MLFLPSRALAAETAPLGVSPSNNPDRLAVDRPTDERHALATKPGYVAFLATALGGVGLRFNNPYRLATPLGDDAESVSRSAVYVDLGVAALFGNPLGFQHGVALRTAFSVEGVGQAVLAPSYVAWRRWTRLSLLARAGLPIVLTPQPTGGIEASVGAAWFFANGIGATTELVGDVFYGAGTPEVSTVTYPMLSLQAGLILSYEVLP